MRLIIIHHILSIEILYWNAPNMKTKKRMIRTTDFVLETVVQFAKSKTKEETTDFQTPWILGLTMISWV